MMMALFLGTKGHDTQALIEAESTNVQLHCYSISTVYCSTVFTSLMNQAFSLSFRLLQRLLEVPSLLLCWKKCMEFMITTSRQGFQQRLS